MASSRDQDGRVAVVAGAMSGIGRARAERLAGAGARVELAARTLEQVRDAAIPGGGPAAAAVGVEAVLAGELRGAGVRATFVEPAAPVAAAVLYAVTRPLDVAYPTLP